MKTSFYMDVHVPYPVTAGLLRRKVDVLTAQWDHAGRWLDSALLDRATALGRVMVSQDVDLLAEAARRQRTGGHFAGLVFAAQNSLSIGKFIADLSLIAELVEPSEMDNHVEYLPL